MKGRKKGKMLTLNPKQNFVENEKSGNKKERGKKMKKEGKNVFSKE